MLDVAITMELFSRMGVGQSWLEVARDFHVTRRTLRRTMQRVAVALGGDIRDFRGLLAGVKGMLQLKPVHHKLALSRERLLHKA